MRISFECDLKIFRILSITLAAICITIMVGAVSIMYLDYDYFKKKLETENNIKKINSTITYS